MGKHLNTSNTTKEIIPQYKSSCVVVSVKKPIMSYGYPFTKMTNVLHSHHLRKELMRFFKSNKYSILDKLR